MTSPNSGCVWQAGGVCLLAGRYGWQANKNSPQREPCDCVGYDLRQGSCVSDSAAPSPSFYPSFCSLYFTIELNGEMLIAENESRGHSAAVLAEMHISSCLSANVSRATLAHRRITKHIWHYKPNSAYFTAKGTLRRYVCLLESCGATV